MDVLYVDIDAFIDVSQSARLIHEKYDIPQDPFNFHLLENGCLEFFLFYLNGMKKIEDISIEVFLDYYA